jgi:hypothetical protein
METPNSSTELTEAGRGHEGKHDHRIEFTVDGDEFTTVERRLSAAQILEVAGLNPTTHYLTLVSGKHQQRLRNDEIVEMHDELCFVSASTEPTPTS